MIRLRLLGGIDLRDDDGREMRPILAQPKRLALLAYLAAALPSGPHRRDNLLAMFWPELDSEHARNALSQAVHFIRRSLGDAVLDSRGGTELALGDGAWTDVREFRRAIEAGQSGEALRLYRGDLLPSFFVTEAPEFERWLEQERAELRAQAARAARLLAEQCEAEGQLTQAIDCARRAVDLSNGDERPLRRLMVLLERLGDRAAAIHAYDGFARRLAAEFEAEPSGETRALIDRIRASDAVRPPAASPSSGAPLTELSTRYRVERELGGGGMAQVLLATETALGRRVALKVLAPELAQSVSAEQFRREIQVAARLHHPHIVPLLAAGQAGPLLYYTMPFVEGESLRVRIERDGPLPVPEVVRLLTEIARALDCAHQHGIVHRDLKPGNVLLSGGQAQVCDFGIAKALAESTDGIVLGTPRYMAPEQGVRGATVDPRSDLYSLGVMGYEMLTGTPPFGGTTAENLIEAHANEAPEPVTVRRPDAPPTLADLIRRLLAKQPAARPASAKEVLFELEALPAERTSVAHGRRSSGARGVALVLVLAILAALAAAWLRRTRATALDPNLVAVAPFDVLDPGLTIWREGMVDILSRDLDGAGPLRTVSPTVAIRRWRGRAEAGAAQELGRRTGAGVVVLGQLIRGGTDSVRLRATLVDARAGQQLGEVELREAANHLDRLLESLTLQLLRELGRNRPVGAVRQASISARSLPALKAFLRGEQFYRRMAWDSAAAQYDHAIELDSGFALAHYHMALAVAWNAARSKRYRSNEEYARQAARLNHGQTTRDSLLLLYGPFGMLLDISDPEFFAHYREELRALETASRLYPGDPEVWYLLGESRDHIHFTDVALAEQLGAFDHAIELDSTFGPAYEHTIEYALRLGDPNRARRYAAAYLASTPTGVSIPNVQIDALLLDPARAGSAETARFIDTVSGVALWIAWWDLSQWPDSAETALRLARALLRPGRSFAGAPAYIADSINRRKMVARMLAFRGHLREAYRIAPPYTFHSYLYWQHPYPDLALLGVVPKDSAAATFGRSLREDSLLAEESEQRDGLPWWAAGRDTASLAWFARRADSAAGTPRSAVSRARLRLLADKARAYLVLAKGDSARALRAFAALPDSVCINPITECFYEDLTRFRLAAALRRDREAAETFDRKILGRHLSPVAVLATLDRGRVAERLGERDRAVASYRFVVEVWRHADAELQPHVKAAREALARLGEAALAQSLNLFDTKHGPSPIPKNLAAK
jgi:serine/threonine-protein kinase